MEAVIIRQFGVEDGSQQVSLAGGNDATIGQLCQAESTAGDRFDQRGTDEDGMEGIGIIVPSIERRDGKVGLEAVQLTAEGVALDGDVHQVQGGLIAVDILCHEDRPGAGAPHGVLFGENFEGLDQMIGFGQPGKGGGLATGHDQTVQALQLLGFAHLDNIHSQRFEDGLMLRKTSLESENADLHYLYYQPRVEISSSSGIVDIWRPTIGSPRSSLTSARILASW